MALLTLGSLLLPTLPANAQTATTWIIPADDAKWWQDSSAWSNGVPDGGKDAFITNSGNVLVDTTTGHGSYNTLTIGYFAPGNLYLFNSGQLSGVHAFLGVNDPSPNSGYASVTSGARWVNSGTMSVGYYGSGNLTLTGGTISNGFTVIGDNQKGTVSIEDRAGRLTSGTLIIGQMAQGELNLSAGLAEAGLVSIGNGPGSIMGGGSRAIVTGGSLQSTGNLYVGNRGHGVLEINGGLVTNQNGYIARMANDGPMGALPVGVATITSGTWHNSQNLYVGYLGSGTLNIQGGTVANTNAYVGGQLPGLAYTALVSGSGLWTTSGTLTIGSGGRGELGLSGGTIESAQAVLGAFHPDQPGIPGTGVATISGGQWVNSGTLYIGQMGIGSGTMTISGGSVSTGQTELQNGSLIVTGGTFQNTTGLNGLIANVAVSGGLLKTGSASFGMFGGAPEIAITGGTLQVGHLMLTGSTKLEIDGGTLASGTAFLAGPTTIKTGTLSASRLVTGGTGAHRLTIQGGQLESEFLDITGEVEISGGQTSITHLGLSGGGGVPAQLNLNGGQLNTDGTTIGSSGEAVATVSGGTWATGNLGIGGAGHGTLNLIEGGSISVAEGGTTRIGFVTGPGGTLNIGTGGAAGQLQADTILGAEAGYNLVRFNHTGNAALGASLLGNLHVLKEGSGNATLTGTASTYTGATTVNSGTLIVTGESLGQTSGIHISQETGQTGALRYVSGAFSIESLDVGAAAGSRAILDVAGGHFASQTTVLGNGATTRGDATVTSGTWSQGKSLTLGLSGTGFLTVNGGVVSSATSTIGREAGSYAVAYVQSGTWNTTSRLAISQKAGSAGALVQTGGYTSAGTMELGVEAGANGNVTLNSGTLHLANDLVIGGFGTGNFQANGGTVTTGSHVILGRELGSTASLYSGAVWNVGGDVTVGEWGTADVGIFGGSFTHQNGILGLQTTYHGPGNTTPAVGTVRVSNNGLWHSTGSLIVGDNAKGTLTVTNGGIVRVANGTGTLVLANKVGSVGILNLGEGGRAGTVEAAEITRGATGFTSGTAQVVINNTDSFTLAPRLSGSLVLHKYGSGEAILTGSSTHTEDTFVHNGTLHINGGAIDDVNGQITVGTVDRGSFVITQGFVRNNGTFLGEAIGAHGSAVLNSGTWSQTGVFYIGSVASGSFTQHGGLLSAHTATVGAQGSGTAVIHSGTWHNTNALVVGSYAEGKLTQNGGVLSGSTAIIGNSSFGGTGSVRINDGEFRFDTVQVANSGTGTLVVAGGLLKATTLWVGYSGGRGEITLSGNEENRGMLEVANLTRIGTGSLSFDGGGVRATGNTANWLSAFATANVGSGGAVFDTNGYNASLGTVLMGSGGLLKQGAGTLTLGAANALEGASTIQSGTLAVAHRLALGDGGVRVESGGTLRVESGISIDNQVTLAGGTLAKALGNGESLAGALSARSGLDPERPTTTVALLAGAVSSQTTLLARFTAPQEAEADAVLGYVLNLSGVPTVGPGQTDLFVLSLELEATFPQGYLGWRNAQGEWVNSVEGNIGNNAQLAQQGYEGTFEAFRHTYGGTLANYIGAWGFTETGVWAVLNHNREFAVVPEPSLAWLVALGLLGGALARRRGRQ